MKHYRLMFLTACIIFAIGFHEGNATEKNCKPLSKSDYIHLVWTTCGEFPGQLLPLI